LRFQDVTSSSKFGGRVSNSKNVLPSFLIKDYWVTEILRNLQNLEFRNAFVFKGGTSLSKAFNLINRFSEDVDLLFINELYLRIPLMVASESGHAGQLIGAKRRKHFLFLIVAFMERITHRIKVYNVYLAFM